MPTLLLRRLFFALIALLCILYLASLGLSMARGLPFGPALGQAGRTSGEYIWQLLQGDPGLSTSRQREPLPAGPVIAVTIGRTSLLLGVSLSIAALLGVLLGGLAARRRRSPWSLPILLASLVGTSIPSFLLAMLLQVGAIAYYRRTGIRLLSLGGFKWSAIWLPAIVLAARPLAQISRVTFFSISEVLEQDYTRTALSKGVSRQALFRRHVYRNVAIPVLTTLVTSLRFALVSLPVVEFFFSWPGAGEALLRAIRRQDDALVYGLLLCLGLLFILMNALLELLYRIVDPRLRDGGAQQQRHIAQLRPGLGATLGELGHSLLDSAPIRWLRRLGKRRPSREPSAFSQLVHRHALERGGEELGRLHRRERRRAWLRAILLNPPLLLGLLLLIPLLGVILFGPALSPHNPYNTVGLRFVDGQMQVPPFPPETEFPWGTDALGRDMLSLLLNGAQQTLLMAAIVMLSRIALGSLLGLLAGWFESTWFDRLVGNLIEIIAAFPALLCAMVLILALGIRRGMISFVVALCFVGWGEVAQFVRAQVVVLKPRPFIEAAVVTGARWPQILSGHILPNLLSPLVGLAALEMGAVLMLLGELGFVGLFIGGGAFAELVVFGPPYYYSDVPEWAALLANIRGYARSYPWMAWPPALAFATTILAFNLAGEGMLRLIERLGASFTRLLNRYTALAGVAFIVLIAIIRAQTGPLAFYQPLAKAFDGQRALAHVEVLAGPDMADRRMGTEEIDRAADYIAAQFEAAGLRSAGQLGSYFQEEEREYIALTAPPALSLLAADGSVQQSWTWRSDFNVPSHFPYRVNGRRTGELVFVGLGPPSGAPSRWGVYRSIRDLTTSELAGKVILPADRQTYEILRQNCPSWECPIAGALLISDDPTEFESFSLGTTYSPSARIRRGDNGNEMVITSMHPALLVNREVASFLVDGGGSRLEALEKQAGQLDMGEILLQPLDQTISLEIQSEPRRELVRYVLGYIPGGTGTGGAAGQRQNAVQKMDDQIVILMAAYDSPGEDPSGTLFPAAQDSAAGVSTLIEIARSWQEADYRPKRAVLFAAYVGQGVDRDQSYRSHPSPDEFLYAASGFSQYKIWSVLDLRGMGDAQGQRLVVDTGSTRLGKLLVQAARKAGVGVLRVESVLDLEAVQEDAVQMGEGQDFVQAQIHWEGGEDIWGTAADGPETVSAESLERAGRAISLAMMVLGREWDY